MDAFEKDYQLELIEAEKKAKLEVAKLMHKNKVKEIELEKEAKKEIEQFKFDNIMSHHRIRRADRQRNYGQD